VAPPASTTAIAFSFVATASRAPTRGFATAPTTTVPSVAPVPPPPVSDAVGAVV
jgi:hypothetical protein